MRLRLRAIHGLLGVLALAATIGATTRAEA